MVYRELDQIKKAELESAPKSVSLQQKILWWYGGYKALYRPIITLSATLLFVIAAIVGLLAEVTHHLVPRTSIHNPLSHFPSRCISTSLPQDSALDFCTGGAPLSTRAQEHADGSLNPSRSNATHLTPSLTLICHAVCRLRWPCADVRPQQDELWLRLPPPLRHARNRRWCRHRLFLHCHNLDLHTHWLGHGRSLYQRLF